MGFFAKHKKKLTILLDVLLIIIVVGSRFLTDYLVTTNEPCDWTLVGAQCGTCGGTRCVNHLLNGDIVGAFQLNPLVFSFIVYVLFSVVLLHIFVFGEKKWAGKWLTHMYSLKAFFIALGVYFLFIILRNLDWLRAFFTVLGRR